MIRRHYIETTDVTASEAQLALAEELIDAYVGPQQKYMPRELVGKVTAAVEKTIVDERPNSSLFGSTVNSLAGCVIEIIGGTGMGQSRRIVSSDPLLRSVTYEGDALNPAVDTTSVFKVYQLGKFPRRRDVHVMDSTAYRAIPDAVKQATIAQVNYILEMGDDYFVGDDSDFAGESIGNYSYSKNAASPTGIVKMIAPQARNYLRGIKNRKGVIVAEDPTWL